MKKTLLLHPFAPPRVKNVEENYYFCTLGCHKKAMITQDRATKGNNDDMRITYRTNNEIAEQSIK